MISLDVSLKIILTHFLNEFKWFKKRKVRYFIESNIN